MADANVVFNVQMDDKQAQAELNRLTKAIQKTQEKINNLQSQHNGLAEQLKDANNAAIETYNNIERLKQELAASEAKTAPGGNVDPDQFAAEIENQRQLKQEIATQEKLLASQEKQAQKLNAQDEKVLQTLQQTTKELERQQGAAGDAQRQVANAANKNYKEKKKETDAQKENNKETKKSNSLFNSGFGTMLKYGLGIRSLYAAFSKLRSAIKEGISTFAKLDKTTKTNINNLKGSLSGLKASLGAAFAPIVNAVAPLLTKLVQWLSTATEAVGRFFSALTGQSYRKAILNQEQLAAAVDDTADAMNNLSGLDEMNTFQTQSDTSGTQGITLGEEEEPETIGWIERIKTSVQGLWDKIEPIWKKVKEDVLDPLKKWFNESLIPTIIETVATIIDELGDSIEKSKPYLKWFYDEFLKPLAAWTGDAVIRFLENLQEFVKELSNSTSVKGIQEIIDAFKASFEYFRDSDSLPEEERDELMEDFVVGLFVGIHDVIVGNFEWFNKYIKEPFVEKIKEIFGIHSPSTVMAEIGEQLGEGLKLGIQNKISAIVGVFDDLKGRLNTSWNNIKLAAQTKFNSIKETIASAMAGAQAKVAQIGEKIRTTLANLKLSLPHIKLPHIQVTWDDTSNTTIGRIFGLNAIPKFSVSWYARGGIVDAATLFGSNVVGEDGKEAIIPLERHTEWIGMVAKELAEYLADDLSSMISSISMPAMANGTVIPPQLTLEIDTIPGLDALLTRIDTLSSQIASMAKGNAYTVNAECNNRNLFSVIIEEGKRQTRMTGKNPFVMG